MKPKVKMSLLNKMRIFIVLLIIFPVVVMAFFGIFQYAKGVENNVTKSARDRMEFAMGVVKDRLTGIEESVNSIPYDYVLNDIYTKRRAGELNDSEVYTQINTYLFSRTAGRPYLKMASFYFVDAPNQPYMSSYYHTYSKYISTVHSTILDFTKTYKPSLGYFAGTEGDVFIVKKLADRNTFDAFGTVIFQIDRGYLFDSATKAIEEQGGTLVRYSNGYEFTIGTIRNADKEVAAEVFQATNSEQSQYSDMGERYMISGLLSTQNLTIQYAAFMPAENLRQEYFQAMVIPILIILVMIPVLVVLATAVYRNTMVPIRDLVSKMKLLQTGKFGVQAKGGRKDELGFVVDSFNEMSNELKRLVDYVYKEEVALKEAQLEALQSQINPHFLYNTLEIVNWKARLSGDEEIPEIISALGTLLDAGMNRGGQRLVRLEEELKNVEAYNFLLKLRYNKKLNITLDVDTNTLEATVPKLILQPILENAVYHGIEPVGSGTICIDIHPEGEDLVCIVKDDGAGMEETVLKKIRADIEKLSREELSHTHIGLVNVHERIRLTFGEGYGVYIESEPGKGTTVTMLMKFLN